MLNKNLRVGMEVWDINHGKGIIKDINPSNEFSIIVRFDELEESYNHQYKIYKDDKNRSLYFSEPVITAELEPVFLPTLLGKPLLVTRKRLENDGEIYNGLCDYEDSSLVKFRGYVFEKINFNIYTIDPNSGKLIEFVGD